VTEDRSIDKTSRKRKLEQRNVKEAFSY